MLYKSCFCCCASYILLPCLNVSLKAHPAICAFVCTKQRRGKCRHKREVKTMPSFLLLPQATPQPKLSGPTAPTPSMYLVQPRPHNGPCWCLCCVSLRFQLLPRTPQLVMGKIFFFFTSHELKETRARLLD